MTCLSRPKSSFNLEWPVLFLPATSFVLLKPVLFLQASFFALLKPCLCRLPSSSVLPRLDLSRPPSSFTLLERFSFLKSPNLSVQARYSFQSRLHLFPPRSTFVSTHS